MRHLLLGNPNVGKSSVFNLLTNSYAHVGNYTGVTVEAKIGEFPGGELIDLPGTYSVAPSSEDEGIVTRTLLTGDYDGLINVVDATHLKRNLHLTIQLLELGKPIKIILNMMDELNDSGKDIDFVALASALNAPVYPFSARSKMGLEAVKASLLTISSQTPLKIEYPEIIEQAIAKLEGLFDDYENKRFMAIQLLEGNTGILECFDSLNREAITAVVDQTEQAVIGAQLALSLKGAIFNARRQFIDRVVQASVKQFADIDKTKARSHRIDSVLTHSLWGSLIFIIVILSVYTLTFDLFGNLISDLLEGFFGDVLTPFVVSVLGKLGLAHDHAVVLLLTEGVIAGVGGVLVFLPQIAILFIFLALLEGTGYMARVAMMLDTLLSKFGLNGKAVVPLVTGVGCNVPAIMATRTIADKRERLLTIMIIPFMSCSARIPIYGLIASIFFNKYRGLVILSMYLIGAIVALLSAKLLSLSIFKDTNNQFVLEIPPYRLPSFVNIYRYTKMRVVDFVMKAGKFILIGTIVVWFLQYVGPSGVATTQDSSFLAYIGRIFAPVLKPLGFGNWQASSSLIVGFFAKEMIYSAMMTIYGSEAIIGQIFNPASAYAFLVFSLLYLPCLATVSVIQSESKSNRFTALTLVFGFVVAYLIALIAYNIGLLFI